MSASHRRNVTAIAVALGTFILYRATLLPGVDLGDTPSFQVMSGEPDISPRDGYPLYYAIGRLFAREGSDRAYAMNLASATEGAVACGLVVLVASELSGSVAAAAAAALLLGGSYTFWSQSIIAEVYALHLCFASVTLLLLLGWERRPTFVNLGWFFALYAIGFGNHLMMVLLLPAYTLFLLIAAPGGWRSFLRPRVITLASICAVAGALQYLWNFHSLWAQLPPPAGFAAALREFWFDVTKSDWRDTMILRIPGVMYGERLRMYAFDVRQQFGWLGPLVAALGLWRLSRTTPRRAWLLSAGFLVNVLFALGYNVGDTHVFLLPAHLLLALCVAPGLVWLDGLLPARGTLAPLALALIAIHIYQEYPALDRSRDRRPLQALTAIADGIDDRHAVLVADTNWQVQNGLTYFTRRIRPDIAMARMSDVALYAPAFVADNLAIDRMVVLTSRAKDTLERAYGPLFELAPAPHPAMTLAETVSGLPPGTRYVLTVLKPEREFTIDRQELHDALDALTAGRIGSIGESGYSVVAGVVREAPALLVSDSLAPFRDTVALNDLDVTIRMDSWLGFDTIRRMGFGHVVVNRRHTLIVERGISFVAFNADGEPLRAGYAAGIFAPEPRFVVTHMAFQSAGAGTR